MFAINTLTIIQLKFKMFLENKVKKLAQVGKALASISINCNLANTICMFKKLIQETNGESIYSYS